jgi:hypothetical protein
VLGNHPQGGFVASIVVPRELGSHG